MAQAEAEAGVAAEEIASRVYSMSALLPGFIGP